MSTKPKEGRYPPLSISISATVLHRGEKDKIFCESKPKKCIPMPFKRLRRFFVGSFLRPPFNSLKKEDF
jgi:hypothetical protein